MLGAFLLFLIQPLIARRYGKIQSVVLVQGASIPFIVVLGFAPWIGLVIVGTIMARAWRGGARRSRGTGEGVRHAETPFSAYSSRHISANCASARL